MNTIETDLKRAIISKGFLVGLLLEILILCKSGFCSDFYLLCMPVAVSFPYATAWLNDYQSGFIKLYLHRTSIRAYIIGKFAASALSGGLMLTISMIIAQWITGEGFTPSLVPVFASGCFWAAASTTLAAVSGSRYVAYGGGFVFYYLLVIMYERYFTSVYCLCPNEWIAPKHIWAFDEYGVLILLSGLMMLMFLVFNRIVRRGIQNA